MRAKYVGNKADKIIMNIKNGEATANIPRGTPVILNINTASATDDGLSVVLPGTAGNVNSHYLRFGVSLDTYTTNQQGEAILFGVSTYTLITRMTRAATTDSWTSSASFASGVALGIDTINNAFLTGVSSAGSLPGAGAGAWLLDSLASSAASASATSDTRTVITNAVRAFIRFM